MTLKSRTEEKPWKVVQGLLPSDLEKTLNSLEEDGYTIHQVVKVSKAFYVVARLAEDRLGSLTSIGGETASYR